MRKGPVLALCALAGLVAVAVAGSVAYTRSQGCGDVSVVVTRLESPSARAAELDEGTLARLPASAQEAFAEAAQAGRGVGALSSREVDALFAVLREVDPQDAREYRYAGATYGLFLETC